jgi:uncharacterized protein
MTLVPNPELRSASAVSRHSFPHMLVNTRSYDMTPQERELVTGFLNNLKAAQVPQLDPEADALIRQALAAQPQAGYLLVQQALMQQAALQQAQVRIAELERVSAVGPGTAAAVQPVPSRGGWGSPGGDTQSRRLGGGATIAPPDQAVGQAVAQARAPASSGLGGFLGAAATTALGVAGGAMLFQGLQGLFGGGAGHQAGGGFLGGDAPLGHSPTNDAPPTTGSAAAPAVDDPFASADPGDQADPFAAVDGDDSDLFADGGDDWA